MYPTDLACSSPNVTRRREEEEEEEEGGKFTPVMVTLTVLTPRGPLVGKREVKEGVGYTVNTEEEEVPTKSMAFMEMERGRGREVKVAPLLLLASVG